MTRNDVKFVGPKAAFFHIAFAAILLSVIYFNAGLKPALAQLSAQWMIILALIVWVGLVFLVNLFLSPLELQKEADAKIFELEGKIDDRERRQLALNKLWQLRSDGIALRNTPVTTEAEFMDWRRRYEEWRENTLQAAEERSVNLREWIKRLERMGPLPNGLTIYVEEADDNGVQKSEHYRLARIMTEILVRLQKHLEKDLT